MGRDLAIDLGTANTLVYRQGDGIVFDQPTIVALHTGTGQLVAIGDDAGRMIGGDSGHVVGVRPLREGTITEFDLTQRFVEAVLRQVGVARFSRPRVVVCVPSESSEVEKRAIEEAVGFSGGKHVTLVEEPLAAAIGAGLPVHEPVGNLIADIGGARSEMAVVSMGGVVSGHAMRVGGFDLDAAIQEHLRARYGVAIGEMVAEELKIAIGSAFPAGTGRAAIVLGRELATGNTVEVKVDEDEVRQAMAEPIGPDRGHGAPDPGGGTPRAHARRLGDRDVPDGGREPPEGLGPAARAGVRGARAHHGAPVGDRRARRRDHARAPGGVSIGVPARAATMMRSVEVDP